VKSIVDHIQKASMLDPEVIVCGGGRMNMHLMQELGKHLKIYKTEDFGIDGDFLEAGLCAWIAYQTVSR
jgi:1,6-anhydro-N-acetylmuramate kinase